MDFDKSTHEFMVYGGQLDSYEKYNEVIRELKMLKLAPLRFTGSLISMARNEKRMSRRENNDAFKRIKYCIQADGSMLLMGEEGWKDVKVGRVFKNSDCIPAG